MGGALIAGLSGKREEELRLRQQKIDDEDRVISRKIKDLNIKREEGNLADMQAQRAAKAQALRQTLAAKGGLDMAIPSMEFDYGENDEFRAVPPQAVARDAPLGGPQQPQVGGLARPLEPGQVATNVPQAKQLVALPGHAPVAQPAGAAGAPGAAAANAGTPGGGGGLAVGPGTLRGRSGKGDTVAGAKGLGAHGAALLKAQDALRAKYGSLEAAAAMAKGNPDEDAILASLYDQNKGEIETLQSALAKGVGEVSQARTMNLAREAFGMFMHDGNTERALRFIERNGGMPGLEFWRNAKLIQKDVPDPYTGAMTKQAWVSIGDGDSRTTIPLHANMAAMLNLSDKELVDVFSKVQFEGEKNAAKLKVAEINGAARRFAAQTAHVFLEERMVSQLAPIVQAMQEGRPLTAAQKSLYYTWGAAVNSGRALSGEFKAGSAAGHEERRKFLVNKLAEANRNVTEAARTMDPNAIRAAESYRDGLHKALNDLNSGADRPASNQTPAPEAQQAKGMALAKPTNRGTLTTPLLPVTKPRTGPQS